MEEDLYSKLPAVRDRSKVRIIPAGNAGTGLGTFKGAVGLSPAACCFIGDALNDKDQGGELEGPKYRLEAAVARGNSLLHQGSIPTDMTIRIIYGGNSPDLLLIFMETPGSSLKSPRKARMYH